MLRWLSREVGTLDAGIKYHLENEQLSLWRLLDPVIRSLPDQGVEAGEAAATKRKREESDLEDEPAPLQRRKPEDARQTKKKKTQCLVCKKRHEPLCPLPEGFQKQKKAKGKASGKGKPPQAKTAEE